MTEEKIDISQSLKEDYNDELKRENLRILLYYANTCNSHLVFKDLEECQSESEKGTTYYKLTLLGGLNGRGHFLFYMDDVASVVKQLMNRYSKVWLIEWINDCPDDTFSLSIGLQL